MKLTSILESRKYINQFDIETEAVIAFWNHDYDQLEFLYDYDMLENVVDTIISDGYSKIVYCNLVRFSIMTLQKKDDKNKKNNNPFKLQKKYDIDSKNNNENKKHIIPNDYDLYPDKLASGLGCSIKGRSFIIKKRCWSCEKEGPEITQRCSSCHIATFCSSNECINNHKCVKYINK